MSSPKKEYIESGTAAHDALRKFFEASKRLGRLDQTLPKDFRTTLVDHRDKHAEFPLLIEQRLAAITAKREKGGHPGEHLIEFPTRMVAETLENCRYLGGLMESAEVPGTAGDKYRVGIVYDYLRNRTDLEVPEGSPDDLKKTIKSWNDAVRETKEALRNPVDGSSEYDLFNSTQLKKRCVADVNNQLRPFRWTNPLREALQELTYSSLPPLPLETSPETSPRTLRCPSEECWTATEKISQSYFKGDTAKEYNSALKTLKDLWTKARDQSSQDEKRSSEDRELTSEDPALLAETKKLHEIAYQWPDKVGESLGRLHQAFRSENEDTYQASRAAALNVLDSATARSGKDYAGDYKRYADHILGELDKDLVFKKVDNMRKEYLGFERSEKSADTAPAEEASL